MTRNIIPLPPLGLFSLKTDLDGEIKEVSEHHALWTTLGQTDVGKAKQVSFFYSILRQSNKKSISSFFAELRNKQHDSVLGYFSFGLEQRFLKFDFVIGETFGELCHFFGTVSDLTDLSLVARHYQNVLDASQAYTWRLDLSKREAVYGPSLVQHAKFGPGSMSISIEDWSKALHPDDAAKAGKALEDLKSGKKRNIVVEYRRRGKSRDWIQLRVHAGVSRYGFNGEPLEINGISFNITPQDIND